MTLERKAFLYFFVGVAMFLCLLLLPLLVLAVAYSGVYDSQSIMRFTLLWAIVFVSIAGLIAWGMTADLDPKKDVRLVQLQLLIHDGKKMMLCWNPVGWTFLVLRETFGMLLMVLFLIVYALVSDGDGGGPFD